MVHQCILAIGYNMSIFICGQHKSYRHCHINAFWLTNAEANFLREAMRKRSTITNINKVDNAYMNQRWFETYSTVAVV